MTYNDQIERLISISKNKPLLSENFIPWDIAVKPAELFLPENLVSLQGLPEFVHLTDVQKWEVGCH